MSGLSSVVDVRARRASKPLLVLLGILAGLFLLLSVAPASATAAGDDEASIAHVESTDDGLRVLVNVPPGAEVDLSGVTASLDGDELDAAASLAESETVVRRTAILVIDTSASMRKDGRFEAAKEAALAYLDAVPADVEVGIVTFDSEVSTALEPTTERDPARAVIGDLALAKKTLLYDGLLAALEVAGAEGQRSLLVLSDGADTGRTTTIDDVTTAVGEANALVDVVSLGQTGPALTALEGLADAGNGQVIETSGDTLSQTFADEAAVLASQVLVEAPLPAGFDAEEATVEVSLPTAAGDLVASAFAPIQEGSAPAADSLPEPANLLSSWNAPDWLLYAGVGVFGVGLLTAAVLLVPAKPQPMSVTDRLDAYSGTTANQSAHRASTEPVLGQAKAAAAGVLEHNRGLEQKMAARLSAAGSGFKPSEWLLLQVGVTVAATMLGFLVGGGNIFIGLLFLLVGYLTPHVYLRFKASRRRKAFDSALPDTLQLMSGALAAGLSLAQSVDTVVREGQDPIASEFKRVLVENRIGVPLEDAFDGVASRFESRDLAWAVMAIRIQRQVGGNLAELLNTVAATMREREYLRRQVHSLAAEGKLSAVVLCGLPPGFFLFVLLTRGEYVRPLFTETLGLLLVGVAASMLALGVFWMSRLIKVEI